MCIKSHCDFKLYFSVILSILEFLGTWYIFFEKTTFKVSCHILFRLFVFVINL